MFGAVLSEKNRTRKLLLLDAPNQDQTLIPAKGAPALRSKLIQLFERAGIDSNGRKKIYARWFFEALIGCIMLMLSKIGLLVLFVLLALFFEISLFRIKEMRRILSFEQDYPTLLIYLATAIRTGQDPLVALSGALRMFPKSSVIYQEIEKFSQNIERGHAEEDSLREFGRSVAHPDVGLFRTAMILSRKEGSSISTCLQRLAKVTRQRQSFRRKIRAAVALQKVSAYAITGCTVVIAMIQYTANPDVVRNAWSHPAGAKALQLGVFLILTGIVWMRRLVASRAS